VAIKSIRKEKIKDEQDMVHIRREIEIMSSLRHPHIISIYEATSNTSSLDQTLFSLFGVSPQSQGLLLWPGLNPGFAHLLQIYRRPRDLCTRQHPLTTAPANCLM
ncbi:hypothetical protein GOODEAATRI_009521, partial [Goodea atripinnis]